MACERCSQRRQRCSHTGSVIRNAPASESVDVRSAVREGVREGVEAVMQANASVVGELLHEMRALRQSVDRLSSSATSSLSTALTEEDDGDLWDLGGGREVAAPIEEGPGEEVGDEEHVHVALTREADQGDEEGDEESGDEGSSDEGSGDGSSSDEAEGDVVEEEWQGSGVAAAGAATTPVALTPSPVDIPRPRWRTERGGRRVHWTPKNV
jgi:hypothetical protein